MAEPIPFREANSNFVAPAGDKECCELPAFRDGSQIVSKWKLTTAEIAEIQRTGVIWLGVQGSSQPPVWISTAYPFQVDTGSPG